MATGDTCPTRRKARGSRRSAGILMYRGAGQDLEVLLVHPGGPLWRNKDDGAWSIPKGEVAATEDLETAARREFAEELDVPVRGQLHFLGEIRQRGGKHVLAFVLEGDLDAARTTSNTFEMEWPPRSGRRQTFPEIDRAAWFGVVAARTKILASQSPLLDLLESRLKDETAARA